MYHDSWCSNLTCRKERASWRTGKDGTTEEREPSLCQYDTGLDTAASAPCPLQLTGVEQLSERPLTIPYGHSDMCA